MYIAIKDHINHSVTEVNYTAIAICDFEFESGKPCMVVKCYNGDKPRATTVLWGEDEITIKLNKEK